MAIMNINGRFAPSTSINSHLCRDNNYTTGNRKFYIRDCRYHKEDPSIIVKWMRRNFGERHQGWDFSLVGGCVTIEIWDDKFKTMYEMWQM